MELERASSLLPKGKVAQLESHETLHSHSIPQAEGFVHPVSGDNIVGDYKPGVLGTKGPIKLTLDNFNSSVDSRIIDVARANSVPELPFNEDVNDGLPIGLGEIFPPQL